MTSPALGRVRRCCPAHGDWPSLARHLVADFHDVPTGTVVAELQDAHDGAGFFRLELADALDCAELIVRYRIRSATSRRHRVTEPSST